MQCAADAVHSNLAKGGTLRQAGPYAFVIVYGKEPALLGSISHIVSINVCELTSHNKT